MAKTPMSLPAPKVKQEHLEDKISKLKHQLTISTDMLAGVKHDVEVRHAFDKLIRQEMRDVKGLLQ